jgi:VWFA-related protein
MNGSRKAGRAVENSEEKMMDSAWTRRAWNHLVRVGFVCAIFPTAAVWGQTAKPSNTPTIKVRVNLVEVRVVVRDEHGKIVEGLKQDDFNLFDNGKSQTISGFSVELPTNVEPAKTEIASASPSTSPGGIPLLRVQQSLPDRFVALLFDDTHMSVADTQASTRGTLALLDTLRPRDQIALYTTSGEMTQEFTRDKHELTKALDKLVPRLPLTNRQGGCPDVSYYMAKRVDLFHDDRAFQLIVADAWHCAYQDDPRLRGAAEDLARSTIGQAVALGKADNDFVYDHIQGVMERLSGMPGQKTMVFISPGFSLDENQERPWHIIDEANRLRIVINTLDARGLFTPQVYDASIKEVTPQAWVYSREQQEDQGVLLANLADGTGGTHFHNSNDMEGAMKQMAGAPAVTYVLLFTPQDGKKDGSFHKLKVELAQNGGHYQLQARNGYYTENKDADPQKVIAKELENALVSPKVIQEMPLELLAKFTKTDTDPAEITVMTRLGIKDVTFKRVADRNVNQIVVLTAIFDANGNTVQHHEKTVELNLTDATYQKLLANGISMKGEFRVKPGNYMVRQVIREAEDGKITMQAGTAVMPRNATEQGAKSKHLNWSPPHVDAPLPSLAAIPPCDVTKVLEDVGSHALELAGNLQNFTAEEQIEYERWSYSGVPQENDTGMFHYVFAFEQHGGELVSREYRNPWKGGHSFPASDQDTGEVALELIFRPEMQTDYEMNCEGRDQWKGQEAWVIRFHQRKDKPRRTMKFHIPGGEIGVMLKGRAWIGMENGQVLHMESNLMHDIPDVGLRSGAMTVDYAPVEIRSRKLQLWLPQELEAFWEFGTYRVILLHTFRNFKLFTVETEDNTQAPKTE